MKKKLYIYRFSDGSCVVDDVDGAKANVHAFWHPEAECVSVEDFRGQRNSGSTKGTIRA